MERARANTESDTAPDPAERVRPPDLDDGRTPVADRIRDRLRQAGGRFRANDCIGDYVEDGELGLTLTAAASCGPRGIRVNCVAPGLVRTPLTARLTANEASLKASEAMHVLGRIGEPAEVAAALAWLLDSAQGWVTGQVLGVDGGLGSVRARGKA